MRRFFEQPWVWALLGTLLLWTVLSAGSGQVSVGSLSGILASAAVLCVVAIGQMLVVTTGNGAVDPFSSLEERTIAYADALAAEIVELAQIGASVIQIDEPAIIKYPEDWKIFEKAVTKLIAARDKSAAEGSRPELALYVYFHDPAPLYEKLVTVPVDIVGLDFTYNPKLIDLVASAGSPKPLGLGLVDGRNTKLEDTGEVARQIDRLLPKIQGGRAYLNSSCGLEYLPRDRAFAKLELLAKIRAAVVA